MTKTDRTPTGLKLVDPAPSAGRPLECLPSAAGEISALASANAPFISLDETAFCSINHGVATVSLAVHRLIAQVPGQGILADRVITAHLRGSMQAMFALRETINTLERMAQEQLNAAAAAAEAEAVAMRLPN